MPKTQAIYDLAARVNDASVDLAMAAALPTADTDDQQHLAALLLRRNRPEATAALVAHFDTLGAGTRQWVLAHVADLYRPLREVARQADGHAAANALEIIRCTGEMKLAYLVIDRLRHGEEERRHRAALCLLDLARGAVSTTVGGKPAVTAAEAAYLHAAVEEAVRLYRHHEQEPVAEAMLTLMPRPLPEALAQLTDRRNPILSVLKTMVAAAEYPAARAALLVMLGVGGMTAAAVAGLRRCVKDGTLGDALTHGHLLALRRVRAALRGAAHAETLWPDDAAVASLPASQQRQLPAWTAALPVEFQMQIQRLVALRRSDDAMTRLAALRRLLALTAAQPSRDMGQAIAAFCEDADEAIAAVALRELVRRKWDGLARILPQLVNGPHERLRRLAGALLAPLGFERLWQRWPQLSRPQRLATGRALLKLDPRFHASVGKRLASADPDTTVRALAIIADLNQGPYFEEPLLQLSRHADRRIASAAVKALGCVESPQAHAALEQALENHDARIRANAVEALEQLHSTRHVHKLVEMAGQDDNRPRANAIKALMQMRTGDAMAALALMLGDARARHRQSALWLVETLGLVEVARHVAELAVADPEPAIKQRAERVMQDLIDSLHNQMPATPLAPPTAGSWCVPALLLAAATTSGNDDYWKAVSSHFSTGSNMSLWWIAVATGLLLALLAILSMRSWRMRAEAKSAPMLVFRRIAQHVGLDASDQWLLVRIARQQQLPTPLTLLLSAGTLMHHGTAYAATLNDRQRHLAMLRLDQIRRDLFDAPASEQAMRQVA